MRERGSKTLFKGTGGDFWVLEALQPLQSPIIKGFMRFYEPLQKVSVTISKNEENPIKSRVVTHVTVLK